MIYIDDNGNEITKDQLDFEKGALIEEQRFVKHHDVQEAVSEKGHYAVDKVYTDIGIIDINGDETDSRIEIVDAENSLFNYIGEGEAIGMDVIYIIDTPQQEAHDAYDEYETVYRYHVYTDEELDEQEKHRQRQDDLQDFFDTGVETLKSNTTAIEDLTLLLSDLVGNEE
jgi:hypothetical protein